MTYQDIPGWFDFPDIYTQAVEEAQPGDTFVEVGTWLGRSAAFMAQTIKDSGKPINFFCVDTFKGTPTDSVNYNVDDVYNKFLGNVKGCDLCHYLKALVLTSEQASHYFKDGSLSFVFVDADHSYEAVKHDIQLWLPKVKKGGVLAGHDFPQEPVAKAVLESLNPVMGRIRSWWYKVV